MRDNFYISSKCNELSKLMESIGKKRDKRLWNIWWKFWNKLETKTCPAWLRNAMTARNNKSNMVEKKHKPVTGKCISAFNQ